MRYLALFVLTCAATASSAAEPKADSAPANWDGPLCKPVDRETAYEFTTAPSVRKVGSDRYEIAFAVKSKCDVAVAIEDSSGRIVRHLVYGVLGPNAPAPLRKDSLQQTLYWDGKDESGKYVSNPEKCAVRVSIGLNPTFDRIIGYHPQDTSMERCIAAMAADAGGVYVLQCGSFNQLRKYDHDGNYIETLYPWNPDKLDRVDIPKRTLPDAKIWRDSAPPAGSRVVPVLDGYGTARPFGVVQDYTCLAVAAAKMCMYTKGGFFDRRRLLRLRTDGTTGGDALEGATFNGNAKNRSFAEQGHIALSPDARWVYVSGMACGPGVGNKRGDREPPPYAWNAVYRFAWDAQGAVCDDQDSFLGEVSRDIKKAGADTDNAHFDAPQGLACDSQGRLYVADHGNNRVQAFSPDGKYLKTIPVKDPQEIAVHPKTGEIYVLCFQKLSSGIPKTASLTLVKFGPLPEAAERFRQTFVAEGDEYAGQRKLTPVMALDGWAAEPRVWLVHKQGVVRIYADKGKEFQLFRDFRDEVQAAGFTPHFTGDAGMGMIVADPVRGHVYRGSAHCQPFARLDPEEGKAWQIIDTSGIRTPSKWRGGLEEMCFSWSGLLHVRHLQYVARFNPDKFKPKPVLGLDNEVPFDYGEELHPVNRRGEAAVLLRGVITIPWAMGGANGYNNGFTVSPRGDILANVENYQSAEAFTKYGKFDGSLLNVLKKDMEDRYRPAQFPGRVWSGSQLIFRWDARGQASAADIVPGVAVESQGIRTDRDGNLYIGLQYHQNVNDRPHIGGSLAKFAPKGARLLAGAGTPVALEEAPNRPPDFHGRVWAKNMFWSLPGLDQIHFVDDAGTNYPCPCYHCKFDTDPYGRCFVPRAYGYHVAVVDTNGNRICEIGRYGNADRPAMKPGDTDIGLGNCSYVATVSDKWLYINDEPNFRIIRVKLGYQTEQRVALGGQ